MALGGGLYVFLASPYVTCVVMSTIIVCCKCSGFYVAFSDKIRVTVTTYSLKTAINLRNKPYIHVIRTKLAVTK